MRASKIDGWLFCDHHHRDPIAARILGLDGHAMATRRWFYFIPSRGEPRKLVHRIENGMLDSLPGSKQVYSGWEELHKGVAKLLGAGRTIAMQYSPENNIPYIGLVDAGTIELVRKLKKKVVTSADLVQKFEAAWTAEQLASHLEAGAILDRIVQAAFERAAAFVREGRPITEYELQQWMLERFRANELTTAEPPIAAVQPNNGNPHYEPTARRFAADSRWRSSAARYLGQMRPARQRLLRHHLDGLSGRARAGRLCENFSHRAGRAKSRDRVRERSCVARTRDSRLGS